MGRAGKGKTAVVISSDEDEDHPRILAGRTRSNATQANPLQSRKLPNRSKKPVKGAQDSHSEPKTRSRLDRTSTTTSRATSPNPSIIAKGKENGKAGVKNLYSFFNAATQKQQSQVQSSFEKNGSEEIEDDIGNDATKSTATSFTRNEVCTASRKRDTSVLDQPSALGDADSFLVGSQKYLKTRDGKRAVSASIAGIHSLQEDKGPWTEKYCPLNLEELAVHKKKVTDVTQWLDGAFSGKSRKRLLILKGPAGSGKTATMLLLAKALKFEINEWKNPATSDYTSHDYVSVLSHFEDYIGRSGQFGTLELSSLEDHSHHKERESLRAVAQPSGREAVLIEEFPNVFMRSTSALHAFRSTIQQFLAANTPSLAPVTSFRSDDLITTKPIVMIISETHISTSTSIADSFTAQRLLGSELLHHFGTTVIEFNPIAPTLLTKALELVIVKEAQQTGRRRMPGPQILKSLAETGDIRNAVSTLEFVCIRGDDSETWGSKIAFTKRKSTAKEPALTRIEQESMKMITNRGSSLDLFHGLGKILYNKRHDPSPSEPTVAQPPSHLPQHRRVKVPENGVDELMDEIGADVDTFISALHENYALSCGGLTLEDTLDCIDTCIDSLSDADFLGSNRFSSRNGTFQNMASDGLRQNEISFQVSVRGLLFALPSPVKRKAPPSEYLGQQAKKVGQQDAFKMFFPASIKLWKRREELEDLIEFLVTRYQRGYFSQPRRNVSSHAFAKKAGSKSTQSMKTPKTEEAETGQTRMGSGNSAKIEGLLEYLPYAAILQRSQGTSEGSHELERVARFHGIGLVTEVEDDDDAFDVFKKLAVPTRVEERVEKLILSEDDIED